MKLLAVSGGPDSMALLYEYRKKKIVVAHVNYQKRQDSDNDMNIVKDFCKKYNIPCEIKIVTEIVNKNFQSWARDVRYNFFKKIYDQYNCNQLIMAHHKDDFLETAIMQQRSKREPEFFGIRPKVEIQGMKISRPYIYLYWKKELVNILSKHNVQYATDYTNELPIYERNKIRIELSSHSEKQKQSMFKWFRMSNNILAKKNKKVEYLFKKWSMQEFSIAYFKTSPYQEELIFKFVYKNHDQIKLTKKKIDEIIKFVCANTQAKNYKLNNDFYITKEQKGISLSRIS